MFTIRAMTITVPAAACAVVLLSGCGHSARTGESSAQDEALEVIPAPARSEEGLAKVASLIAQGDAAYESGQWTTACDAYNHALTIDPANEQARVGLDASL